MKKVLSIIRKALSVIGSLSLITLLINDTYSIKEIELTTYVLVVPALSVVNVLVFLVIVYIAFGGFYIYNDD